MVEDCNGDIKLAQSLSQSGKVYRYCNVINRDVQTRKQIVGVTTYPERYILNLGEYKAGLWKCTEPILLLYSFITDELKILEKELTNDESCR
jgi:hypothetical protein